MRGRNPQGRGLLAQLTSLHQQVLGASSQGCDGADEGGVKGEACPGRMLSHSSLHVGVQCENWQSPMHIGA